MDDEARGGAGTRADLARVLALLAAVVAVAVGIRVSGWDGPAQLRDAAEGLGPLGAVAFVAGYAVLVTLPVPASVLTLAAGALYGVAGGAVVAWAGALLGALGGFALGRRVGRGPVDRLLGGRLQEADRVLGEHGLTAVLLLRLVPLFPFTPLNYACGLLSLRARDYLLGTALGIVPGALAYAALGASGSDPVGIVVGATALVLLTVGGGWWGRRLRRRSDDVPRCP
ncbi:TVP38/TMEM64 family protein [Nocardioides sp.]|uniref:TVP38/TMEM64 family protein n=1 Tax=Nocardioides sp. TaxID=35761 RepID=UPI003513032A